MCPRGSCLRAHSFLEGCERRLCQGCWVTETAGREGGQSRFPEQTLVSWGASPHLRRSAAGCRKRFRAPVDRRAHGSSDREGREALRFICQLMYVVPFRRRPPIIESHFPSLAQSPAKTLPRQFARIANTPSYNPTKNGISVSAIEREKFRFREVDLRHEGCSKLRFCETPEVAEISTCMRTIPANRCAGEEVGQCKMVFPRFCAFFGKIGCYRPSAAPFAAKLWTTSTGSVT